MAIASDFVVPEGAEPTRELLQLLERLDPFRSTGRELEARLREQIRVQVAFFPGEQVAARLLFHGAQERQALGILLELERATLRRAMETLVEMIEAGERQEDYWPEGRLNAGIACGLLDDMDSAQRYLQEALDLLSGKGLGRDAEAMLA